MYLTLKTVSFLHFPPPQASSRAFLQPEIFLYLFLKLPIFQFTLMITKNDNIAAKFVACNLIKKKLSKNSDLDGCLSFSC